MISRLYIKYIIKYIIATLFASYVEYYFHNNYEELIEISQFSKKVDPFCKPK